MSYQENRNKSRDTLRKPARTNKPRRQLDAHEFMLLNAKRNETEMRFDLSDGTVYGQVVNFDKFSIIVKDKRTSRDIAIFKSAIESFTTSEHAAA